MRSTAVALVVLCAAVLASQTVPPPTQVGPTPMPPASVSANVPAATTQPAVLTAANAPSLLIGPGDLITVSVFGAPDYNNDVRVAETGEVTLPLIGAIRLAGLNIADAQTLIQAKLAGGGYFNKPQVSVFVKEYATQGVSVLGEVQKPGIYPLLGAHTLFDAISAAQGTTQTAGDKATIIHRDKPNQPEVVKLNYDATGSPRSNIAVTPGDTVVVQKAGIVYVVGDVQKPTGVVMAQPGLTVLQAIAMAQGTNPTAALNKARLIRKTPEGPKETPLELKKMLAAKAPDMLVQPEDVIFVPTSGAKSAAKRGLDAALQAATGVVIYGRY